jgi:hypothetical protein
VVRLALRITETRDVIDSAAAAEVGGRLGAVLKDRNDFGPGLPELLVGLIQLDEVFPTEGSPKMPHEGEHQRPVTPVLGKRHVALSRLNMELGEGVAHIQHYAHRTTTGGKLR